MNTKDTSTLDRRRFIKLSAWTLSAGAVASTGLPLFHLKSVSASAVRGDGSGPVSRAKLGNWEDLYRQRWSWDYVSKGTHGWLNCRSACEWDLYVKNGVVVREEQTASYEASEEGVPDFNPRGCQKGACYTDVMYGPSRLTVPLKRVGERGDGQWKKISWDQAIDEIAHKMVDISVKHGTEAIVHDLGPHFDAGATTIGRVKFFSKLGATLNDDWAEIGDLNIGATLAFGFPHMGGTSDEWFLSDFLVVWMMNPSVTQIPDAHFLYEARYNGTELVVIDPQYSATAVHADQWVPIKPGTDAALALTTARHIWETDNADWDYVKEQTDLPILINLADGRFLRESDIVDGGKTDLLYMWDQNKNELVEAPGCEGSDSGRLFLEGIDPAIEGPFTVTGHDGKQIHVTTVGSTLKEQLGLWTFEATAELTGLNIKQIRKFADGFAKAKRPMVLSSWGSNRFLHSDLMNRAKILCLSLKGAIGRKGSGYSATGWVELEGQGVGVLAEKDGVAGLLGTMGNMVNSVGPGEMFDKAVDYVTGRKSMQEISRELSHEGVDGAMCMTNSASFNYKHQGIKDVLAEEQDNLGYPKKLDEYVTESQKKGWMPVHPDKPAPRAWVTGGNNVLRRTNMPQIMLKEMWPEMELIIDVNPKLTFTGMHADYLLPAAGYYEKPGFKYAIAYIPYLHYYDAAIPPLGESKDEWEIFALLAKRISEVATAKKVPTFKDTCTKNPIDLKQLHNQYSNHGALGPKDAQKVNETVLKYSMATQGMTLESLKKTGIAKYSSAGITGPQGQIYNSDWKGEGVITPSTHQVKDKWAWPTLTGRQQCYIDHPWFIEAGESLPTHKDSPHGGGDFPLQMISCHSRWSVHSIWRDTPLLLRLQRGEPVLYLNPREAKKKKLADGAWGKIFNRLGHFRMRIKHSTMVRPGVAYYFHAWEPHQFPEHKSYKWISPGLMNPLHFAGGEGHLGWRGAMFEPGTHVQDTRVDITPWTEQDSAS